MKFANEDGTWTEIGKTALIIGIVVVVLVGGGIWATTGSLF